MSSHRHEPHESRAIDPGGGGAHAESSADPTAGSIAWRIRLIAAVLLLAALSFRQAGGRIVPDTKLDLTENPGALMARALHMWDPSGGLGQLQNQAYGYLFPVGPFHWLLTSAHIPEWVVQRLWWTTILGAAFIGMWRLTGAMGVGSPWSRYVASLIFAVGPRFMSEVAVTSVEVWPMAVAPWVLLPLVDPRRRSWTWRISCSALAFLLVGGVNAVATGAVLIPPVLWFLTRTPWRSALRWAAVWLCAVAAVSVWWLVPLVLLGQYSPPFLDWIENASVTTAFASPFEALRGTTPWLNYLSGAGGPSWPAGWQLVTSPILVVVSAGVALAGLAGLPAVPARHRSFLGLCLLSGFLLVTLGHTGAVSSPWAEAFQDILDGPLAPLRNTHKFELIVRLPLAIGLAQALTIGARRAKAVGLASWLMPVTAVSVIAMVASPAITSGLPRPEGYEAIPQHWRDAAAWLDRQAEPGTTLVVPAAGFADFTWGSTKDDPLQALSTRPFVVRDAVPLGSAGTTRWLDNVENRLQAGEGGASLRSALASAGVRFVLVRNDLRPDAVDSAGAQGLRVHEALAETGLRRAASFGPLVASPPGLEPETPDHTVDQRTRLPYPSVEVFDVGEAAEAAIVGPHGLVTVQGGSEDVPDVLASIPGATAAIVGTDVAALPEGLRADATEVVTDGNASREVFFGRASNNTSQVLTPEDPRRTGRTVTGFVADPSAPQTQRGWHGMVSAVTASSSAADANASIRLGPGYGPDAAVDGDPTTAWLSGRYASAVGEWIELRLRQPTYVRTLSLTLEQAPRRLATPTTVRVDSDAGSLTTRLAPLDAPQEVRVSPGTTSKLRVTIVDVAEGSEANGVGIGEIGVPGIAATTQLDVPPDEGKAQALLLRRTQDGRSACAWVDTRPLCVLGAGRQPEAEGGIRRTVLLPAGLSGAMSGAVVARPGEAVERLLTDLTSAELTASSRAVREPAGRPASAMDGDLGTGWVASPTDQQPLLSMTFPASLTTDRVQLQRDPFLAASAPTDVAVAFDDADPVLMEVDDEGYLRWERRSFSKLVIQFLDSRPLRSTDSASGIGQILPVGVSEVVVPGFNPLGSLRLTSPTGAPCGFGPELIVDGQRHETAVNGTVNDLLTAEPLSWTACAPELVSIPPRSTLIDAVQSAEFIPTDILIHNEAESGSATTVDPVEVARPSAAELTLYVPASAATTVLTVHQNYNDGWVAFDSEGRELSPIRVNGWQQGWILPGGDARAIMAAFDPDEPYRWGLAGGGLMALLVVSVCLGWRRAKGVPQPPLAARSTQGWQWTLLVVGLLSALAGPLGFLAGIVGVGANRLLTRRAAVVAGGAAGIAAASLVVVTGLWPDGRAGVDSSLAQFLVVAALASCLIAMSSALDRASGRGALSFLLPLRMMGRSTK